ncbi:hypothetical protein Salpa_5819 [Sporomusa sp. KB1]|nr:hypothetical protein Salpa_5819 [Sporomusa sp. KB1]
MNIKMKVNGKSEFNNGTTITTNITLTPVTDTSSAVQAQGSITLVTQDQTFADSINFRDVLELEVSNTSTK